MDYALLGLGDRTSVVTGVSVTNWGGRVVISCLYNPSLINRPYQLSYTDCRELQWDVTFPEDTNDSEAELIGFTMGTPDHGKRAVITTDIFELLILYGSFELQKSW